MSIQNMKTLKIVICGLLLVSVLSIACAGAGTENRAVSAKPAEIEVTEMKVAASSVAASAIYAEDFYPEFEKISVDPAYQYLELKPGDSRNFTVTVENKDNKTIALDPRLVIIPYTENFIDESWVSISPSAKDLAPGEKEEFEVEVNIPEDADLGNYAVLIAFAENVPEGDVAGYYPNFPGTMQLNLQVWVPPTVQILTPYINDLVEAGKTYTYEIKLRNTGSTDIAISPELTEGGDIIYYDSISPYGGITYAFGNDAINVDAPEKVKAGETATVKLTLKVPADAKGSYTGSLNLNIDDPGIRDYEGKVSLNFRILPIPEKPYETNFKAGTNGTIDIEISAYQYGYDLYAAEGNRDRTPSFEVNLKDPSGKEVTPTLISTKYSGSINIIDDTYPQPYLSYVSARIAGGMETSNQGSYRGGTTTFVETYTVPGTEGEWTLSILPKNTENFEYSITIGAAEE
ncbi:COG1470 family protein [Methanosarcina sp. T3]|uniref:COG1470 family protein n=1 Tax=Methanosarcina sp. T3 TaxID=3439062 RepID=UPI003F82C5D7